MTDRPAARSKTRAVRRARRQTRTADKAAETTTTRSIRDIILALADEAGDGSISPGDVAKVFAEERRKPGDPAVSAHKWSRIVRAEAIGLARAGQVIVLRKGEPVDPNAPVKGVIRIRKAG